MGGRFRRLPDPPQRGGRLRPSDQALEEALKAKRLNPEDLVVRPRRALGGESGELDSLFEVLTKVEERCSESLRRLGPHAVIGPRFGQRLPGQLRCQRLVTAEAMQP